MKLRSLLIALFALIAIVALAQNQRSVDRRIKQLEDKVIVLEVRAKELEAVRRSGMVWVR
jgi:hypothetical protein